MHAGDSEFDRDLPRCCVIAVTLDEDRLRIIGKRIKKALDRRGQQSVLNRILDGFACGNGLRDLVQRSRSRTAAALLRLRPFRHVDGHALRDSNDERLQTAGLLRRNTLPELHHHIIDAFLCILVAAKMPLCNAHTGIAVFFGKCCYGPFVARLKQGHNLLVCHFDTALRETPDPLRLLSMQSGTKPDCSAGNEKKKSEK